MDRLEKVVGSLFTGFEKVEQFLDRCRDLQTRQLASETGMDKDMMNLVMKVSVVMLLPVRWQRLAISFMTL